MAALTLPSCSWLDTKPREQTEVEAMFTSYQGFQDALNGAYIAMKERNAYGEKLTMAEVEVLAQNWFVADVANQGWVELRDWNYEGDNARTALGNLYLALYNTVAQANMILAALPDYGHNISDPATRDMVQGEALAIRAFCHLDVLRLFGQMPSGAVKKVSLMYSEVVSPRELPKYYDYAAFVKKIEDDLSEAERLLKASDPVFRYTLAELEDPYLVGDKFLCYRQNRFSYWAVKALQARLYLYTGDKAKALAAAKLVIEAKDGKGNALLTLNSAADDLANGYFALPGQAIMQLNVWNLATVNYSPSVLAYPATQAQTFHLTATKAVRDDAFASYAGTNRQQQWVDIEGVQVQQRSVTKKYYHDPNELVANEIDLTKRQVIPLLRLSEMYLTAIEATTDLTEANTLWSTYMASQGLTATPPFASLDARAAELLKMWRIETWGEGQMFYTHKRLATPTLTKQSPNAVAETMGEAQYVLPLPTTEI